MFKSAKTCNSCYQNTVSDETMPSSFEERPKRPFETNKFKSTINTASGILIFKSFRRQQVERSCPGHLGSVFEHQNILKIHASGKHEQNGCLQSSKE